MVDMGGFMKPLNVLLAELQAAIEARQEVESRLAPLVAEYEAARQLEEVRLAAVQTFRRSDLLGFKGVRTKKP